jgi:hypothetical protein
MLIRICCNDAAHVRLCVSLTVSRSLDVLTNECRDDSDEWLGTGLYELKDLQRY